MNLYNIYTESTITKTERDKLPDSSFGLPKSRQYPLHDAEHVRKAIQMFSNCPEKDRKELANNIFIAAEKYNVDISEKSLVFKYLSDSQQKKVLDRKESNRKLAENNPMMTFVEFYQYPLTEENIDKYKVAYNDLNAVTTSQSSKGLMVVDKFQQIAGYIQVDTDKNTLKHLEVNPIYRRQGIGSKLLNTDIGKLAHRVVIDRKHKNSIGFFKNNGFASFHDYIDENTPTLLERIDLNEDAGFLLSGNTFAMDNILDEVLSKLESGSDIVTETEDYLNYIKECSVAGVAAVAPLLGQPIRQPVRVDNMIRKATASCPNMFDYDEFYEVEESKFVCQEDFYSTKFDITEPVDVVKNSPDKSTTNSRIKKPHEFMNNDDQPDNMANFTEGTASVIDKNYKSNGYKSLNSFKLVKIDKSFIDKYKSEYKFLKHLKLGDKIHNVCWMDKNTIVAIASTEEKSEKIIWIEAIEVLKNYQGYKLGKQVLDYTVKTMHANALSVNKNNNVAYQMYLKYGFKPDNKDHGNMIFMYLDLSLIENFVLNSFTEDVVMGTIGAILWDIVKLIVKLPFVIGKFVAKRIKKSNSYRIDKAIKEYRKAYDQCEDLSKITHKEISLKELFDILNVDDRAIKEKVSKGIVKVTGFYRRKTLISYFIEILETKNSTEYEYVMGILDSEYRKDPTKTLLCAIMEFSTNSYGTYLDRLNTILRKRGAALLEDTIETMNVDIDNTADEDAEVVDYKDQSSDVVVGVDRYTCHKDKNGCYYIKLLANEYEDQSKKLAILPYLNGDMWITSDLHFYHKNRNSTNFLNIMINEINSKIPTNGTLMICGDLGNKGALQKEELSNFISRLNVSRKILLLGNHDNLKIQDYYDMGFTFVTDIIETDEYIFSHCPVDPKGKINICGHIHESTEYWNMPAEGHINVYIHSHQDKIYQLKDYLKFYKQGKYKGKSVKKKF